MIEKMLDELAELYAQRDLMSIDRARLLDGVLTDEQKKAIADIEAEFAGKTQAAVQKIADLEEKVKAEVKKGGESVKGKFVSAVFTKGRVTWDTKGLDGLIVAVPQLSKFRKEGEPSVSIRKV